MPRQPFTAEETRQLVKHFATASHVELAGIFPGRSLYALRVKASKMGIRREAGSRENATIKYGAKIIGHMTERDIAYLAGIIDGEGCLSLTGRWNPTGYAYTLTASVTITNTYKPLIDWIGRQIPGQVHTKDDGRIKTCYYWRMRGNERIRRFCREISPYLLVKREQAELIGANWIDMDTDQRFALVDRVRDLKN